ncbi:hypothetical protein [Sulfitobacter geojensis]|uniref:hypothetical protein n=1 Tax=Sulfitobacter geojensis TaxID=1342299 RepID=UPI0036D96B96
MPTDISAEFPDISAHQLPVTRNGLARALKPAEQMLIVLTLGIGLLAFILAQSQGKRWHGMLS